MQSPETTHDYRPTHNPRPVELVQAEEEAAWCWRRLHEHLETPNGEHYQTEWWIEHKRLLDAANAAEAWVEDMRYRHLNCTCDPDPNRESAVCPACVAVMDREEIPF